MIKILITGAAGQIGSELTPLLRNRYGVQNIIATGYGNKPTKDFVASGPFYFLDIRDKKKISKIVKKHKISTIYHLAALLSAVAEENPQLAWDVNMNGLYNILEVARENKCSVFVPSSIGAFGSTTPKKMTPQDTIEHPDTMYGITKVSGELLCDYYFKRFGVDTRGVRYPGIISNKTFPGGGTTDYAVEIYYEAVKNKKYTCYLKKNTCLEMMYMPDALKAAIDLMEMNPKKLLHRNGYNVSAMSITPADIAHSIKKTIPGFKISYKIDRLRQQIADSWPDSIDDRVAKKEWGWKPEYDLDKMTTDMIEKLMKKLKIPPNPPEGGFIK